MPEAQIRDIKNMKDNSNKNNKVNTRRINVSSKRQITIPLQYFKKLNITDEVECVLEDDKIVIKPVPKEENPEIILKELILNGLSGKELLVEFIRRRGNHVNEETIAGMLLSEKNSGGWNEPMEDEAWDYLVKEK